MAPGNGERKRSAKITPKSAALRPRKSTRDETVSSPERNVDETLGL
jgi:hypothetical protein